MDHKSLFSSANDSKGLTILLSVIAVLSGGMIYVLLRPPGTVFYHWISDSGLDHLFSAAVLDDQFTPARPVPEWILFSLPNGLWAFAYSLLITGIWSGSTSRIRYFWMATIPLLVLGFEILQFVRIIPGTFCMQDLAIGAAGLILGIIVANKIAKSKNHEKAFD
jgi:hypothetical protein